MKLPTHELEVLGTVLVAPAVVCGFAAGHVVAGGGVRLGVACSLSIDAWVGDEEQVATNVTSSQTGRSSGHVCLHLSVVWGFCCKRLRREKLTNKVV